MNLNKISVVIRNKNQDESLRFLLRNLNERYSEDIDEIIVIDNNSTDFSVKYCNEYDAKVINIKKFSYGSSANLAAEVSKNDIIVIFSAHSYPVSWDFFKLIKIQFQNNPKLAGVRCIHSDSDYKSFINGLSVIDDPNRAGLMFCGSAFNKKVWEIQKFKNDITTFEDKEWTKKVLALGYEIEFVPSIYCYNIKRNKQQLFFRFKNEVIGGYQLWHAEYTFVDSFKSFYKGVFKIFYNALVDLIFTFKKFAFMIVFLLNKPEKYD